MKFITESVQNGIEYLVENTVKGKRVYIEGPFMMANAVNRNGRFYPKEVLEAAVDQYLNDYVNQNRATGELNHPDYPFPDPKKAAIFIESLYWQGDNVIGKAKVLNIGDGLVIQELLEAGFKLGVSTRGLGDLKTRPDGSKEVYKYAVHAVDAVDFPSGQTCYVKPVNESVEWVINESGVWAPERQIAKPEFNSQAFLEACRTIVKQPHRR